MGGCAVPFQQVKQRFLCRDFTTHLSGKAWGVGEAAGKATCGKGDVAALVVTGAQTELLQGPGVWVMLEGLPGTGWAEFRELIKRV